MDFDDLPPLARRLKELRDKMKMSQQQLAAAAGLSVSLISQLEQGSREDPRLSTVIALAKALGVDCRAIAEGEDPPASRGKKRK